MKTWITGGYVYRYEKRRLERKNLCMEDGRITRICSPSEKITDGIIHDVKGNAVVPGFIDIHTHGGCGFDVNAASKEKFQKIGHFCTAGNYNLALFDSDRYQRTNGKGHCRSAEA